MKRKRKVALCVAMLLGSLFFVGNASAEVLGIWLNGPNSVDENRSANFQAFALYSDYSTGEITNLVNWSTNNPIAQISNGILSAGEVNADLSIVVTANYAEAIYTDTAKKNVTIVNVPGSILEGSHAGYFSEYNGTKTCLTCHYGEALEVHSSVHYQWKGDNSSLVNDDGTPTGKFGGINDFCIYPDINWIGKMTNTYGESVDGGCGKCHAGLGIKPSPDATIEQLENIDCLICHSGSYKRKVDMVGGVYRFVPDVQNMGMSILEAAVDIALPSNDACLNCHTKSGGGNNYKRGDIEEAHRNPSRNFDVHLSRSENGGAGLKCTDCHTTLNHEISGRGVDLRPGAGSDVRCENCHTTSPHGSSRLNKHTKKIDCTVCHIPTFAKSAPTDMYRHWDKPGEFIASKGLFEPAIDFGSNEIPMYKFWNGNSYIYQFGDAATPGDSGRILMAGPIGDVNDVNSKIFAFKHHKADQPIDPITNQLLPLKIGLFFQSGDINNAVEIGANLVGWGYNGHEFAPTERYMGIFHGVEPKENALNCNDCHYSGTRLDFSNLGYSPRETRDNKPLCASCHRDKSGEWSQSEFFDRVHRKHVDEKRISCNNCHFF